MTHYFPALTIVSLALKPWQQGHHRRKPFCARAAGCSWAPAGCTRQPALWHLWGVACDRRESSGGWFSKTMGSNYISV